MNNLVLHISPKSKWLCRFGDGFILLNEEKLYESIGECDQKRFYLKPNSVDFPTLVGIMHTTTFIMYSNDIPIVEVSNNGPLSQNVLFILKKEKYYRSPVVLKLRKYGLVKIRYTTFYHEIIVPCSHILEGIAIGFYDWLGDTI